MPDLKSEQVYRAGIYIRLSKEDGDKEESNSVSNQRDFIYAFLKSKPEIRIACERVDDGYSGVSFDRPAFNRMLSDIKSGLINCVVVKDLSRFGRNYIEAGRYIEQIFPFLGVRFIAVNDGYDSSAEQNRSESIIVPFKNLINDAYSRDISIKIRSQLEIRRKRGDFVGSFPVYGYFRSAENKNRLAIDEFAAETVRDIFKWKIEGLSNQKIADRLNKAGVLSPFEYKSMLRWAYSTSFKLKTRAKWSASAVGRILKNEVYTGVLVQGRETTPNYKVKKRIKKPESEWIKVENTHQAIISKDVFELAENLMKADTRIAPKKQSVYLFSGLLECGGCHESMTRKKIKTAGKEYIYYICTANKNNASVCSSHRINETVLAKSILSILRCYIQLSCNFQELFRNIEMLPSRQAQLNKINHRLAIKRQELLKYHNIIRSLYEDYNAGLLNKSDYLEMKESYSRICSEIESSMLALGKEEDECVKAEHPCSPWVEKLKENANITELNRTILVTFIKKITVLDSDKIEITFAGRDEFSGTVKPVGAADSALLSAVPK